MSFDSLLLVLLSALLHTVWNLMIKRVEEKHLFTWWALVAGSVLYLPVLLWHIPFPPKIWAFALTSAVLETLYFLALLRAYERGDFSLVYPIARGAAPALLALWANLFLKERPSPAGLGGLVLLIAGLLVVGGAGWWSRRKGTSRSQDLVSALAAALCISAFSVIDAAAVRYLFPGAYTVLVLGIMSLLITPVIVVHYGAKPALAVLRAHFLRVVVVGVLVFGAYMLVLQACLSARVSYVGAIREISIVLAALVGWFQLGEQFGPVRTAGAVLIFLGILAIGIAG
ncbi:MAG TPA: DMT family transporter [Syntrophobacteraceae bacterium]|nr:DMT family transporter [Syntrophobacteraceae bacterium]